ncbi:hypothetical protein M1K27_15300 [Clostridioides difficile]|uniref:Uncharacterized protein n=1 Tax=Clostridioides difficile TaxID=1496 RepID=A0AB74QHA7_CLODI|nr:hypothetical protein [Clostridioides difficile]EGT4103590.1 hypothetical protein [Clostridioides difficile]EGT4130055.1 hypothetical protein [Clostridioides difficile]EGT4766580.1 hypothetical protein [Clostridioides difficile]EJA6665875.1 hypothetical protein [Clostridioides difficile]EKJ1253319.1 hypothetical protein [Clostridioides difficile]
MNDEMITKMFSLNKTYKMTSIRLNLEVKGVITHIDKNEIVLEYYDNELECITTKILTIDDIKYNDYNLKPLH